jgi:hypothetical protein
MGRIGQAAFNPACQRPINTFVNDSPGRLNASGNLTKTLAHDILKQNLRSLHFP